MRKAIATIAIGDGYQLLYRRHALPLWQRYARRHGYEIVCFEEPLDTSPRASGRSPAWQKLLVLGRPELAHFDRVVWLDTDIAINPHLAPCIAAQASDGRLGICEETDLPDLPLFATMREHLQFLNTAHRRYHGLGPEANLYAVHGFDDPPARIFNTGVMVLGARDHRAFLEHVYERYEDKGPGGAFEMGPLSYCIARGEVAYQVLDPRFNALWLALSAYFGNPFQKGIPILDGRVGLLAAMLSKVYFLHFAGLHPAMRSLRFIRFEDGRVSLDEAAIRERVARLLGASPAPAA